MNAAFAAAPPPAATAPLTLAQLKGQLWADNQLRVFAVLMGSRIPELPTRLAAADLVDYDCLLPGALEPEVQRQAPYLVQLRSESTFTDWLLFESARGLPAWGVLALARAEPLALRGHMRSLSEAQLPDGQSIKLDWMDPVILRALLPLFDAAGLSSFMGPMRSLVVVESGRWSTAEFNLGQLQWRSVPVLA
jgi:hypothetical protein